MVINRLLKSTLCVVKGHIWGKWEYESTHSCVQAKVCKRNSNHKEHRLPQHDWSEWIFEDERNRFKFCKRCDEKIIQKSEVVIKLHFCDICNGEGHLGEYFFYDSTSPTHGTYPCECINDPENYYEATEWVSVYNE